MTPILRQPSGFAVLSPQARHDMAVKGGQLAHLRGVAHEFTHDEAVKAGSKGGLETKRRRLARQQEEGT